MTLIQSAALEYLGRGWSVFPMQPVVPGQPKRPRISWEERQTALPTVEQVAKWWEQWPDAGIGLALGKVSNVVRIDLDGAEAATRREEFGETLTFASPTGGIGLLFQYREGFASTVLWKGDGPHEEIRFLSDGRYSVIPPTSGYIWLNDSPIAPLPNNIVDSLLSIRAEKLLRTIEMQLAPTMVEPAKELILEALAALHPARCDDRDSWLQVGMALHSASETYLDEWIVWSRASEKFKEGECEKLWADFQRRGGISIRTLLYLAKQDGWSGRNLHEPLTDVGNGNTLSRACSGGVRFCRQWDDWLRWDGKRWCRRARPEVVEEQKRLIRDRYNRACSSLTRIMELPEEAREQKLKSINRVFRWCMESEDARHIHAAVDMASSTYGILTENDALDKHPWLLNCTNGIIDLRTAELLPHDQSLLLTQLCPTAYSREAICPRWDAFLAEVFCDTDLVAWFKRFAGCCLTGITRDHVLPIFYGTGRNGKSTLIKALISILGEDYATTAPPDFLVLSRGEQHPTRIAELYGKRFVADLETSEGAKLNESMIKRLTGGDQLVARRMHEDFWKFDPTHKLVLATNHRPEVRNSDIGIWSRLKLVPFNVSFLGREDRDLDAKLQQEAPGILRWAVEGCLEWQKHGLGEAERVTTATTAYRSEQDKLAEFLATCIIDAESRVRTEELMRAYISWCANNNIRPMDGRPFGRMLTERGFALDATRKFRLGIRLA